MDWSFLFGADEYTSKVLRSLEGYCKRFRKLPKETLASSCRTLVTIPGNYCRSHPPNHTLRLIFFHAFASRHFASEEGKDMVVRVRQLKGGKVGLCVALCQLTSEQRFSIEHLLRSANRLVSGIRQIRTNSFFLPIPFPFFYLEIKKARGKGFSSEEVALLRTSLGREVKAGIETLVPSLFFPPNEEEALRSAVELARELKFVRDLPQVKVRFQKQLSGGLRFLIVVARLLRKGVSSWETLIEKFPNIVEPHLVRVTRCGFVRNRYPKEVALLYLDVENTLFLRANGAVDLGRARGYVVKLLESILGPVRDFNGGLLDKKREQLDLVKKAAREKSAGHFPLLELLFYSIQPGVMQALLPSKLMLASFDLLIELIKLPLPSMQPYILLQREEREGLCVVVKRPTGSKLHFDLCSPDCLSIATGEIDFEGYRYTFWMDLESRTDLTSRIRSALCPQEISSHPHSSHTLRINFSEGDPPSLHPHFATDIRCRSLIRALFEGLTRVDPEGETKPAGAERIALSPCRKRYLFTLRPHFWSNGERVTAHHYVTAWKRAIAPHTTCLRPDLFFPIKRAREAHAGGSMDEVGVRADGDDRLVVELTHPQPHFLELVAHPIFSPLYGDGEEPTIFNGPYLLRQWREEEFILLTQNSHYWDRSPLSVKEIHISFELNPKCVYERFCQGEIDWVGDPFSLLAPEVLQNTSGILREEVSRVYWLYCNTTQKPLSSKKLRNALAYAIDRRALVREVMIGQKPHFSPLYKSAFLSQIEQDGNSEYARELYRDALLEDHFSKQDLDNLVITHSTLAGQERLAKALQKQWSETLGLHLDLRPLDWNAFSEALDRREFQLGGCIRSPQFPYANSYLEIFRDRSHLYNSSDWENRIYSNLLTESIETTDPVVKENLLAQAEKILIDEMPVIPLYQQRVQFLLGKRVNRLVFSSFGDVDFKWVILKELG